MGRKRKNLSESGSEPIKRMTLAEQLAQEVMLSNLVNHFAQGNKSLFGRILGRTPQDINAWFHRGYTADLRLIYSKFPSVNPAWLLTFGEGDMLLSDEQSQSVSANGAMSAASFTGSATVNVMSPDSEIAILQERIHGLEAIIEAKDETISALRIHVQNLNKEE